MHKGLYTQPYYASSLYKVYRDFIEVHDLSCKKGGLVGKARSLVLSTPQGQYGAARKWRVRLTPQQSPTNCSTQEVFTHSGGTNAWPFCKKYVQFNTVNGSTKRS